MSKKIPGGQGSPGRRFSRGGAAGRHPGTGIFGAIFGGIRPVTERPRKSPGRQFLFSKRRPDPPQDKRGRDK